MLPHHQSSKLGSSALIRPSFLLGVVAAGSVLAVGPAACSGMNVTTTPTPVPGAAGLAGAPSDDNSAAAGGSNGGAGAGSNNGQSGASEPPDAGSGGTAPGGAGGMASEGGGPELPSGGASNECHVVVQMQTLAAGIHVTQCTAIDYATNPPSSGEHYPIWADFGVYDFPLPRGFWVHNLEHGAVVVTYNCPQGCSDEVAAASSWLAQLAPDATCTPGRPRVLLVPDPKLDVRWAASSWGFTLRADCFVAAAFSDFYRNHAGQPLAPEYALCGAGSDFRAPGADTCGAK